MSAIRLLDTNIVSHAMNKPRDSVAKRMRVAAPGELAVNPIVIGELSFGMAKHPSPVREHRFAQILDALKVLSIDRATAERYGTIRADLERKGTPIGSNDLWIAAHALASDLTLVTADERECRRIGGLRVENWLA